MTQWNTAYAGQNHYEIENLARTSETQERMVSGGGFCKSLSTGFKINSMVA
jgi:hypothetical protein